MGHIKVKINGPFKFCDKKNLNAKWDRLYQSLNVLNYRLNHHFRNIYQIIYIHKINLYSIIIFNHSVIKFFNECQYFPIKQKL